MQTLFHDKHPLAFTSVVCVLGCLFPFSWLLLIFVFVTSFLVSFLVSTVRRELLLGCVMFSLSGAYYQQIRSTYENHKQTLTNKYGHFDIDGEPLEFGYLRIHGMG